MSRYNAEHLISSAGTDLLAAVEGRASIRRYTGQPVEDAFVNTILNAGFCAPSASNVRPWEFVVVRDAAVRKAMADASVYAKMLEQAPVAIVICGNEAKQSLRKLLFEDCAAAAQNMLLCAHGLGLGAVWCGMLEEGDFPGAIRGLLKLPPHVIPATVLAAGWPEKLPKRFPRFEADKVHEEHWQQADQT